MPGNQLPKVPEGLRDLMKGLTKEILREKPTDLYEFSAQFFEAIVRERKDFKVKEFEPVSEYDFMKNRGERSSFPSALIYSIIPVGLTELIKDFIKAVLRQRPENICVFAVDYFRRLQKIKKNERIDYLTFEKSKEPFPFTSYVRCTCGGLKGIPATYNNSNNNNNNEVEFSDKVTSHENCTTNFTHLNGNKQLGSGKNAPSNGKSEFVFDERTIKAVYIIQKFCRRYISKKKIVTQSVQVSQEKAEKHVFLQNGTEINENEGYLHHLNNKKNEAVSVADSITVLAGNYIKGSFQANDTKDGSSSHVDKKIEIPLNIASETGFEAMKNGTKNEMSYNKNYEEVIETTDNLLVQHKEKVISNSAKLTNDSNSENIKNKKLNNESEEKLKENATFNKQSETSKESEKEKAAIENEENPKTLAETASKNLDLDEKQKERNFGSEQIIKEDTEELEKLQKLLNAAVEVAEETSKLNEVKNNDIEIETQNVHEHDRDENEKNKHNLEPNENVNHETQLSTEIASEAQQSASKRENGLNQAAKNSINSLKSEKSQQSHEHDEFTATRYRVEDSYDKETGEKIVSSAEFSDKTKDTAKELAKLNGVEIMNELVGNQIKLKEETTESVEGIFNIKSLGAGNDSNKTVEVLNEAVEKDLQQANKISLEIKEATGPDANAAEMEQMSASNKEVNSDQKPKEIETAKNTVESNESNEPQMASLLKSVDNVNEYNHATNKKPEENTKSSSDELGNKVSIDTKQPSEVESVEKTFQDKVESSFDEETGMARNKRNIKNTNEGIYEENVSTNDTNFDKKNNQNSDEIKAVEIKARDILQDELSKTDENGESSKISNKDDKSQKPLLAEFKDGVNNEEHVEGRSQKALPTELSTKKESVESDQLKSDSREKAEDENCKTEQKKSESGEGELDEIKKENETHQKKSSSKDAEILESSAQTSLDGYIKDKSKSLDLTNHLDDEKNKRTQGSIDTESNLENGEKLEKAKRIEEQKEKDLELSKEAKFDMKVTGESNSSDNQDKAAKSAEESIEQVRNETGEKYSTESQKEDEEDKAKKGKEQEKDYESKIAAVGSIENGEEENKQESKRSVQDEHKLTKESAQEEKAVKDKETEVTELEKEEVQNKMASKGLEENAQKSTTEHKQNQDNETDGHLKMITKTAEGAQETHEVEQKQGIENEPEGNKLTSDSRKETVEDIESEKENIIKSEESIENRTNIDAENLEGRERLTSIEEKGEDLNQVLENEKDQINLEAEKENIHAHWEKSLIKSKSKNIENINVNGENVKQSLKEGELITENSTTDTKVASFEKPKAEETKHEANKKGKEESFEKPKAEETKHETNKKSKEEGFEKPKAEETKHEANKKSKEESFEKPKAKETKPKANQNSKEKSFEKLIDGKTENEEDEKSKDGSLEKSVDGETKTVEAKKSQKESLEKQNRKTEKEEYKKSKEEIVEKSFDEGTQSVETKKTKAESIHDEPSKNEEYKKKEESLNKSMDEKNNNGVDNKSKEESIEKYVDKESKIEKDKEDKEESLRKSIDEETENEEDEKSKAESLEKSLDEGTKKTEADKRDTVQSEEVKENTDPNIGVLILDDRNKNKNDKEASKQKSAEETQIVITEENAEKVTLENQQKKRDKVENENIAEENVASSSNEENILKILISNSVSGDGDKDNEINNENATAKMEPLTEKNKTDEASEMALKTGVEIQEFLTNERTHTQNSAFKLNNVKNEHLKKNMLVENSSSVKLPPEVSSDLSKKLASTQSLSKHDTLDENSKNSVSSDGDKDNEKNNENAAAKMETLTENNKTDEASIKALKPGVQIQEFLANERTHTQNSAFKLDNVKNENMKKDMLVESSSPVMQPQEISSDRSKELASTQSLSKHDTLDKNTENTAENQTSSTESKDLVSIDDQVCEADMVAVDETAAKAVSYEAVVAQIDENENQIKSEQLREAEENVDQVGANHSPNSKPNIDDIDNEVKNLENVLNKDLKSASVKEDKKSTSVSSTEAAENISKDSTEANMAEKSAPTKSLSKKAVIGKQTAPKLTASNQTVSKSHPNELLRIASNKNKDHDIKNTKPKNHDGHQIEKQQEKTVTKTTHGKSKEKVASKVSNLQQETPNPDPNEKSNSSNTEETTTNAQLKKTARTCQMEGLKNEYQEQKYIQYPIAEIYLKSFQVPTVTENEQIQNLDREDLPKKAVHKHYTSNSPSEISNQENETEFSDSLNEEHFERDSLEVSSSKETDIEEDSLEVERVRKEQQAEKAQMSTERMPTYLFGMTNTTEPTVPQEQPPKVKKAIAFVIPFEKPSKVVLKDYRTTDDINSEKSDKIIHEMNETTNEEDVVETTEDEGTTVEESRLQTIFEQNEVESPREEKAIEQISQDLEKVKKDQLKSAPVDILKSLATENLAVAANTTQTVSDGDKIKTNSDVMEEPTFESNDTLSFLSDNDSITESSTFTNSKDLDETVLSDENYNFRDDLEYANSSRRNQQLVGSADNTPRGGIYEIHPLSLKQALHSPVDTVKETAKESSIQILEAVDFDEKTQGNVEFNKKNVALKNNTGPQDKVDTQEELKAEADKTQVQTEINEATEVGKNASVDNIEAETKSLTKLLKDGKNVENIFNEKDADAGVEKEIESSKQILNDIDIKEKNEANVESEKIAEPEKLLIDKKKETLENISEVQGKVYTQDELKAEVDKTEVQNKVNEFIEVDKNTLESDIEIEAESLTKLLKEVKNVESIAHAQLELEPANLELNAGIIQPEVQTENTNGTVENTEKFTDEIETETESLTKLLKDVKKLENIPNEVEAIMTTAQNEVTKTIEDNKEKLIDDIETETESLTKLLKDVKNLENIATVEGVSGDLVRAVESSEPTLNDVETNEKIQESEKLIKQKKVAGPENLSLEKQNDALEESITPLEVSKTIKGNKETRLDDTQTETESLTKLLKDIKHSENNFELEKQKTVEEKSQRINEAVNKSLVIESNSTDRLVSTEVELETDKAKKQKNTITDAELKESNEILKDVLKLNNSTNEEMKHEKSNSANNTDEFNEPSKQILVDTPANLLIKTAVVSGEDDRNDQNIVDRLESEKVIETLNNASINSTKTEPIFSDDTDSSSGHENGVLRNKREIENINEINEYVQSNGESLETATQSIKVPESQTIKAIEKSKLETDDLEATIQIPQLSSLESDATNTKSDEMSEFGINFKNQAPELGTEKEKSQENFKESNLNNIESETPKNRSNNKVFDDDIEVEAKSLTQLLKNAKTDDIQEKSKTIDKTGVSKSDADSIKDQVQNNLSKKSTSLNSDTDIKSDLKVCDMIEAPADSLTKVIKINGHSEITDAVQLNQEEGSQTLLKIEKAENQKPIDVNYVKEYDEVVLHAMQSGDIIKTAETHVDVSKLEAKEDQILNKEPSFDYKNVANNDLKSTKNNLDEIKNETLEKLQVSDQKGDNKINEALRESLEKSKESSKKTKLTSANNDVQTEVEILMKNESNNQPKESNSTVPEKSQNSITTALADSLSGNMKPILQSINKVINTADSFDTETLAKTTKSENIQKENESEINKEPLKGEESYSEHDYERKDTIEMDSLESRHSDTSNSELITIIEKMQAAPSPPQHSPNSSTDIDEAAVAEELDEDRKPTQTEAEKVNWFVGEELINSKNTAPQPNSLDLINNLVDQHQAQNLKQAPQINNVNIGLEKSNEVANVKEIDKENTSNELTSQEKIVSAAKSRDSNGPKTTSSIEEYIKAIQAGSEERVAESGNQKETELNFNDKQNPKEIGKIENQPSKTEININDKEISEVEEKLDKQYSSETANIKTLEDTAESSTTSQNKNIPALNIVEDPSAPSEGFSEQEKTAEMLKITENLINAQKQFSSSQASNDNESKLSEGGFEIETKNDNSNGKIKSNVNEILLTQSFLQSEIVYNSYAVYEEVFEELCIKRSVSQTTINEIDNETEIKEDLSDSNKEQPQQQFTTEELVQKMQKRRSIELDAAPANIKEKSFEQISFDDLVIKTMESIVDSRNASSSTEDADEVVIMSTTTPQATSFDYDPKATLKRLHTIAVDDTKALFKSVTIDETVKYIELTTESETTTTSNGSLCLDEDTSENIRKKMMAYSLSEADSDLFEPRDISFDVPHDDFDINTALEEAETTSTETESTIVSAATKIQAGARGFLTRRRLRRLDTKSQFHDDGTPHDSFGNNAISESLETMVENAAAKKIQKAYRNHRQNVGKSVKSSTKNMSHDNSLAAKRLTLQRGDALRNNSSPEEEESHAENVKVAEMTESAIVKETKGAQSTTAKKPPKGKTASNSKSNELKWLGHRQNSMPVQIDCEVFRVLPKHMRKRITSAEGPKKRGRRVHYD